MSDESKQRIMDGSTWAEFCDTIKSAGDIILSEQAPVDPLTRAEGFRYLSRVTRGALEAFVEFADPRSPVLFQPVHETVKMGADNPDNYYQWARISGEYEYRITGTRGSIHYLGLGTYAGNYGSPARSAETGYLEAQDLDIGPDGQVEIILSCQKQEGNWLPMEPDTASLIVRQMFLDRSTEEIAQLKVERIGGDPKPSPTTVESIDEGLGTASRLVMGAAGLFASWATGFQAHENQLPLFDDTTSMAAHGDPNFRYYHSYWRLAPDEALLIEVMPPECDYWNFQLNNHWMESLDYRHFRIAINKHQAVYEPDGSLRIIVAHEDPDHPNWIQTVGHPQGTMCFRWCRAHSHPQPQTRVVKLAKLESMK